MTVYDAAGTKRRKEVYTEGIKTSVQDYAGSVVYRDDAVSYAVFEEGRVLINPEEPNYIEYHLKDHLGNVRVAYKEDNSLPLALQNNTYYPFGMLISELSTPGINYPNPLKYNAKELQPDFGLDWYDYGWRMYDSQVGRFHTQDRFSEKYHNLSNYQYAANNPIRFIDINGDSISATQAFIKDEKTAAAMKAILHSKAGYDYFAKIAAKGDKLLGFEFKVDGEFSKIGLNMSLTVGELDIANGVTKMEKSKDDAGFDITITIDTRGAESTFDVAETIIHEGLLEANYMAHDIKDNGKNDYSNISNWVKNDWLKGDVSNYGHGQNYIDRSKCGGENLVWPGAAYRVLQDVNKSLNSRLTNSQIQDKMSGFWGFYGQLFGTFNR